MKRKDTSTGRKITDFFAPSQGSSSGPSRKTEDCSPTRKSSRLSGSPTTKAESNVTTSLKRLRSPDVSSPRSKNPAANKDRSKMTKRQKKFESDTDDDVCDPASVIYVKSPMQRGCVKTTCYTSKADQGRLESVPTSQSDEIEMDIGCSVEPNSRESGKCVENRRQASVESRNVPMNDHNDPLSSSPLPSIPSTPNSGVDIRKSLSTPDASTTPISEHQPDLLLSPVALDEAEKTALLIQKIKAEARAKFQQLQDSPPPQFSEALDSSSEEDELLLTLSPDIKCKKEKSVEFGLDHPPFRNLSPSVKSKSRPAMVKAAQNISTTCNPLDALLSEKRKQEKAGRDARAFLQAESTLRLKEVLLQQDEFADDAVLEKWLDESAVQNAIQEALARDRADLEESNTIDISLEADDAARLIGANGGKVADILKRDKANEEQETRTGSACGLRIWSISRQASSECIRKDNIRSFRYSGMNPIVSLLKTAVDRQDNMQAILILETGILSNISLTGCGDLLSFLCEQAFSYPPCALNSPSFQALSSLYAQSTSNAPPFVIAWFLHALAAFGADPTVLEQMGFSDRDPNGDMLIDAQCRDDSMQRLIHVIQIAALSRRIEVNDIPDLIIAIQRVALDPSSSNELRRDVARLVDIMCNLATSETELSICEKAISFNMTLELPYKVQFASVFSSGSGTARRIARWVAYSALTNQAFPSKEVTVGLPVLKGLLDIVETGENFQINDKSDYNMLWHSVRMLGVALTDLELYNAAERNAPRTPRAQATRPGSANSRKNKSTIILIHDRLERLHAEIQDTRALHLDRSRAKAAIKQLSLLLNYQHSDFTHDRGAAGIPRKKTLEHFFSPKKNQ